jgi:hypothetical protein
MMHKADYIIFSVNTAQSLSAGGQIGLNADGSRHTQKRGESPCVYSRALRGNDTMGFRLRCAHGGRGATALPKLQKVLKSTR